MVHALAQQENEPSADEINDQQVPEHELSLPNLEEALGDVAEDEHLPA